MFLQETVLSQPMLYYYAGLFLNQTVKEIAF